jgi:cysteine desulfuration protein SufE
MSPVEQDIVDEFDLFDDWMAKYDHIISLGKELPAMEADLKTDDNLIRGCQSRVWLHATCSEGKLHFTADSDAIITRGMVALLLRVVQDRPAAEVAREPFAFLNAIGLMSHLSPTRANGLASMVKQIKFYALAFTANPSN